MEIDVSIKVNSIVHVILILYVHTNIIVGFASVRSQTYHISSIEEIFVMLK